jgi:hypothetical protein
MIENRRIFTMSTYNIPHNIFLFALLFITSSAFAGQTAKYTGTVYASPVKHLMPLGNGDAVLIIEVAGIVALSGNPPTMGTLTCSGMGIETPDENTTTDFYCNIKENGEDSFDLKGKAKQLKQQTVNHKVPLMSLVGAASGLTQPVKVNSTVY